MLALKKDSGGRSYEYCLRYRSTAAFCHSGIGKMELNPPPLLILLPNSTAAARSGSNGSFPPVVPPTVVTWGMDAGNEGRNAHGTSVAPHAKYGLGTPWLNGPLSPEAATTVTPRSPNLAISVSTRSCVSHELD